MNNRTSAGILLLALGLFPIIIWYIYLTVSNPICQTWMDVLEYVLTKENQLIHLFYTSITFGLLSIVASVTYFSKASNSNNVLLTLLVFCVIQAITALLFTTIDTSIIYLLSVFISYMAYKNPNKALKVATKNVAGLGIKRRAP